MAKAAKNETLENTSELSAFPKRIFDARSGLYVYVLNARKDPGSVDRREGILSDFARKLDEERIEPTDLVKRAWKTSE